MSESEVIDDAVRDQLRQASTATIATQLFKLGLRNQFLTGLTPLNPERCRFVGEATTLRYIPMREDLDHPDVYGDPAQVPVSEDATRNGSTPISTRRVTAPAASLVWTVLNTRWPVSDAWIAISAVSLSRISPTMMTSGS